MFIIILINIYILLKIINDIIILIYYIISYFNNIFIYIKLKLIINLNN